VLGAVPSVDEQGVCAVDEDVRDVLIDVGRERAECRGQPALLSRRVRTVGSGAEGTGLDDESIRHTATLGRGPAVPGVAIAMLTAPVHNPFGAWSVQSARVLRPSRGRGKGGTSRGE
jgi:hypothetical protein